MYCFAALSAPLPPCDPCPITPVHAALTAALSRPGNPQAPVHTYLKFLLLHSILCLEKHSLITLSHSLCEVHSHNSWEPLSFTKYALLSDSFLVIFLDVTQGSSPASLSPGNIQSGIGAPPVVSCTFYF